MSSIQITVPNDKGSQKFTIGEIARMILETHESSPEVDTQTVIMEIMKQAEGGEPPVSFRHGIEPPDEEIVFVTTAGHPYKLAATAARSARVRADLQYIDWETVSVDGGWAIREIYDTGSWFEYWANKETMTADEIGYMVLVSTADMTRFCRSAVYREWASQLGLGVPVMFGGEGTPLAKGQEDAPAQATPAEPSDKQEKSQRNRKRNVEADAALRIRINKVLATARREWPDSKSRPGIKPMARELGRKHRKELGYKFSSIRQILDGTYSASIGLGIGRL